MPPCTRHVIFPVVALLLGTSLSGCGTINEKLAAGVSDAIPSWAGGLPPDAPPRPGTPEYEEFMREQERKRVEPAMQKDKSGASPSTAQTSRPESTSALAPVH